MKKSGDFENCGYFGDIGRSRCWRQLGACFAVYTLDINLTVLGCDNKKEHRDKRPNLPLEMIIG